MTKKTIVALSLTSFVLAAIAGTAPFIPVLVDLWSHSDTSNLPLADELNNRGFYSVQINLESSAPSASISYEIKGDYLYLRAEKTAGDEVFEGWIFDECNTPLSTLNADYFSYDILKEYIQDGALSILASYSTGHHIYYELNGGAFRQQPATVYSTKYANYVLPRDVEKEGFRFLGWTTIFGDLITELNGCFDFDLHLYAQYASQEEKTSLAGSAYVFNKKAYQELFYADEFIPGYDPRNARFYDYVFGEFYYLELLDDQNARLSIPTTGGYINYVECMRDLMIFNYCERFFTEGLKVSATVQISTFVNVFDIVLSVFPDEIENMTYCLDGEVLTVSYPEELKMRINNLFGKTNSSMNENEFTAAVNDLNNYTPSLADALFPDFTFLYQNNTLTYCSMCNLEVSFRNRGCFDLVDDTIITKPLYDTDANVPYYSDVIDLIPCNTEYITCSEASILSEEEWFSFDPWMTFTTNYYYVYGRSELLVSVFGNIKTCYSNKSKTAFCVGISAGLNFGVKNYLRFWAMYYDATAGGYLPMLSSKSEEVAYFLKYMGASDDVAQDYITYFDDYEYRFPETEEVWFWCL